MSLVVDVSIRSVSIILVTFSDWENSDKVSVAIDDESIGLHVTHHNWTGFALINSVKYSFSGIAEHVRRDVCWVFDVNRHSPSVGVYSATLNIEY